MTLYEAVPPAVFWPAIGLLLALLVVWGMFEEIAKIVNSFAADRQATRDERAAQRQAARDEMRPAAQPQAQEVKGHEPPSSP